MKSKFTEAFDSLASDGQTKLYRTQKILSACGDTSQPEMPKSKYIAKSRVSGKRWVALLVAAVIFIAVIVSMIIGFGWGNRGAFGILSLLKDTYVNMDGVAAFGVWNAPDSSSDTAYISDVGVLRAASASADEGTAEDGEIISGDWSDDDRYDWESDYDWDPTKANVLIAFNDDGTISEVVYERTNGRGQIRQDSLGNATKVYVSRNFTYVEYVSDDEWRWWNERDYMQSMSAYNGTNFGCHHERIQTVVIHNATGKVFALNDIIEQVNQYSGDINHTLYVQPLKDDTLYVKPLYGNYIPQWYNVRYDENAQSVYYELVIPPEVVKKWDYRVSAVRHDIYGQQYILAGADYGGIPAGAGIVNLPSYIIYGNSMIITAENGVSIGSDGRVYCFDGGALKVFGKNFALTPVSPDTEVVFEGIFAPFITGDRAGFDCDGINYTLKGGYLFSMFGEVWKVGEGGYLTACQRLEGSFPARVNEGYLIGGEVIGFVDTEGSSNNSPINGRLVHIQFNVADGQPSASITHIIDASEISCDGTYMYFEQNEAPYTTGRGNTKYYFLTVKDGVPYAEHFANGHNGGMTGLVKPLTQPVLRF